MQALSQGGKHDIETVVLPDGEQFKSVEVLMKVWDKALQSRLDRNSTFVALGGGVIGDMCGFAAAAYQRGVHFVQVGEQGAAICSSPSCRMQGLGLPWLPCLLHYLALLAQLLIVMYWGSSSMA